MTDIDEDGSPKSYTGHYVIGWTCLIFMLYSACAFGGFIMWLIMRKGG
jgi:hypothetical protein